jgi:hypothetical protein
MNTRRFPPPWRADKIPGGYVVRDANGQAIAYVYSRETEAEALQAKVLTKDEARRIAINIARLPELLGKGRARGLSSRAGHWIHMAGTTAGEASGVFVIFPVMPRPRLPVPDPSLVGVGAHGGQGGRQPAALPEIPCGPQERSELLTSAGR